MLAFVVVWHLTFWVIAPWLAYRMLPLDTLELLGWGQEWQWGYYKHPPLGAWLGELTLLLSGGRLESLYLLAQLCLVATLIYVWKTARMLLDPARAALAAVLLEGSYFHTFLTPNFNMNSLQLPLWAGLAYHFLRAWRGDQFHWLMVGLFAALCLLAKYSGLLLLASCALVVVGTAGGRLALRRPGIYLGAALALLLLLPHLVWLSSHAELPFAYLRGFDQSGSASWSMHLTEPLRFALSIMHPSVSHTPMSSGFSAANSFS
jgi:4-amino-4-deoxy-L-arabinose transferase-like glycosyltransferase